ncbi:MAG: hypothetical protein HOO91_01615 [Bacteroidales bacterium]|nr:hypothetical protein [Bacteroidales bacterium]
MSNNIKENSPIYIAKHELTCLDTSSKEKRYRLVSNKCDIEINDNVKLFIDFIKENEGELFGIIINKSVQYYNTDESTIKKSLDQLITKGVIVLDKIEDGEEFIPFRNKSSQLWFRKKLIETENHKKFFSFFHFAFSKAFIITVVILLLVIDIIFWKLHSNGAWKNELKFFSSYDYVYIILFSLFMTFIHETGHISAAMKYNAKTGGIGIGMYFYLLIAWADIHESWSLKKRQSMMISIGGLYFNAICFIPFTILGIVLKSRAIIDFVILSHFTILFLFNPFLKMDGYWFITEWVGVPNLQTKITMFFKEYLPSLVKKERKRSIFSSYSLKVKSFCVIYAFLTGAFMVYFMYFIIHFGITMLLNFDREYVGVIVNYIDGSRQMYFNTFIRNTFLLVACTKILWGYLKKVIQL